MNTEPQYVEFTETVNTGLSQVVDLVEVQFGTNPAIVPPTEEELAAQKEIMLKAQEILGDMIALEAHSVKKGEYYIICGVRRLSRAYSNFPQCKTHLNELRSTIPSLPWLIAQGKHVGSYLNVYNTQLQAMLKAKHDEMNNIKLAANIREVNGVRTNMPPSLDNTIAVVTPEGNVSHVKLSTLQPSSAINNLQTLEPPVAS